jgi:hypothetical protein
LWSEVAKNGWNFSDPTYKTFWVGRSLSRNGLSPPLRKFGIRQKILNFAKRASLFRQRLWGMFCGSFRVKKIVKKNGPKIFFARHFLHFLLLEMSEIFEKIPPSNFRLGQKKNILRFKIDIFWSKKSFTIWIIQLPASWQP